MEDRMRLTPILTVMVMVARLVCCGTSVQADTLAGTFDYTFEDNSGTATLLYDNSTNTATISNLQLMSLGYLPDTSGATFMLSLKNLNWEDIAPSEPFATIAELNYFLKGDDKYIAGATPDVGSSSVWLAFTGDPSPTYFDAGFAVDNGEMWIKSGSWSNLVAVPEPSATTFLLTGSTALLLAAWACGKRKERASSP